MSNSLLVANHSSGQSVADNTTEYLPISGCITVGSAPVVADVELPVRLAGTFSNAFAYVISSTASNTTTITLQKSQVDTAIVISVGGDLTGIFEDTSNSASFVATDEVNWEVTVPTEAGTNLIAIGLVGCQFTPTDTTKTLSIMGIGAQTTNNFAQASVTRFQPPQGNLSTWQSVEDNTNFRIRDAFTSSNFYTYVSANARTTDTIFGTRKNDGGGNQSVTYTSGETGAKEDTSNTDSLVAGDDYNYHVTTGTGTENITIKILGSQLVSTTDSFAFCGGVGPGFSQVFNVTNYHGLGNSQATTTEAIVQIYPRFTFTARELGSYVSANTIATDPTTVHLMDNGGASALTVSYAAAETGLKNDSSNTVEITSGADEIDYRVATPNTSGSITFRWIGMLGDTSVASTAVKDIISMGYIAFAR